VRRLYFVVHNIQQANRIAQELMAANFDSEHMQVIYTANFEHQNTKRHALLPKASLLQSSDFYPAVGRGIPLGACVGLLIGIVVSFLNPSYAQQAALVLLTGVLAGSMWGAWVSGIVGIALPNSKLEPFQTELAKGAVVLVVQVKIPRVGECTELVTEKYPHAQSALPDMFDLVATQ
jgi:hypothetical protein